jgi:pyridoxine/pyridoxamine 5'-phosphate oxidase
MNRRDLHEFMVRQRLAVVSSIGPAGTPQSALVGIATAPDLEIVFDTVKTTRKYANLVARPHCSLVLGWSGEQTVQLEGDAAELTGAELERLQRVYFDAWPDGPTRLSWPGITYFAVRPRWIRYSDFAQNPPLIVEL